MRRLARRRSPFVVLPVASALVVVGVLGALALEVGRPYPGFLVTIDARVHPLTGEAREAGFRYGDRIVDADGRSPLALVEHVRSAAGPVTYTLERDGRTFTAALAPRPFTWALIGRHFAGYFVVSALMLLVGVAAWLQNRQALPNRNFLLYMCLWAVANVVVPEAMLGPSKVSSPLAGFVPILLVVHGWVFFLTYPGNPRRQRWLDRHRVVPRLYAAALGAGIALTLTFAVVYVAAPRHFTGPLFAVTQGLQFGLAVLSFPVKVLALLDTRRQAASPLVNQQTAVLLLGIGLGLGLWVVFMLAPVLGYYPPPIDPQIGSALVLLYPLAIAYATVRYRLFDAAVVVRRSVVYTALAAAVAATYALVIAAANAVLAGADVGRSPWFTAAFTFAVALGFYPVRERLQRAVDRTFFRERYDHGRTIQQLARSMTSLLDLDEITRRLTLTIEAAMHVRGVRLVTGPPPPALAAVVELAPGALSRYQVAADPSFAPVARDALSAYGRLEVEVVVPLRFQGAVRGALLLGSKRSEAPYTAEDLALLETVADQAAVAVANAEAHRTVIDYARQLERSLMIRTNLAKFVPRRARQLIEESPEAPPLDKREADVTVLFADITGYTQLSARLDPDELDGLVERYFSAFLDEIVKHGGDVNETAGDGLMAIFHEGDHAVAAVDAACAIQRRAAELNAARDGRSEPLTMHLGINSGPALLGATKIEGRAGTRWTYTASGLTTNVAARLAAVAGGGEVVMSAATRARLPAELPVEDLGQQALKNVDRAVRAYRLR